MMQKKDIWLISKNSCYCTLLSGLESLFTLNSIFSADWQCWKYILRGNISLRNTTKLLMHSVKKWYLLYIIFWNWTLVSFIESSCMLWMIHYMFNGWVKIKMGRWGSIGSRMICSILKGRESLYQIRVDCEKTW